MSAQGDRVKTEAAVFAAEARRMLTWAINQFNAADPSDRDTEAVSVAYWGARLLEREARPA
jgi:hypothetical protein